MPSATSALYEPLIERDLDAIPAAVRAFASEQSIDELFLAVARFAVLAYAPSLHAKRAVIACLATHSLREESGEQWLDLLIECARYAAESRQPWSEPPILEPPALDAAQPRDLDELRAAMKAGDRLRGERWLAARLDDAALEDDLRAVAGDEALLITTAAFALIPILGEKGRYALLRMPIWELTAGPQTQSPDEPLDMLVDRVVASRGSVDTVQPVFVWCARHLEAMAENDVAAPPVYHLARDYAQTLIAHAAAKRRPLPIRFLDAVHDNLANGPDFSEWSFA